MHFIIPWNAAIHWNVTNTPGKPSWTRSWTGSRRSTWILSLCGSTVPLVRGRPPSYKPSQSSEEHKLLLASFFFFHADYLRSNSKQLVATITYQIAVVIPGVRLFMEAAIDNDPIFFPEHLSHNSRRLSSIHWGAFSRPVIENTRIYHINHHRWPWRMHGWNTGSDSGNDLRHWWMFQIPIQLPRRQSSWVDSALHNLGEEVDDGWTNVGRLDEVTIKQDKQNHIIVTQKFHDCLEHLCRPQTTCHHTNWWVVGAHWGTVPLHFLVLYGVSLHELGRKSRAMVHPC